MPASQVIQKAKKARCSFGCIGRTHGHGLCHKHYNAQYHQAHREKHRVRSVIWREKEKVRRGGSGVGRVVIYTHPVVGVTRSVVPEPRRCRGCCGWASYWFNTVYTPQGRRGQRRKSRHGLSKNPSRGYPVCLDCSELWRSYGRIGSLTEMPAGYGVERSILTSSLQPVT